MLRSERSNRHYMHIMHSTKARSLLNHLQATKSGDFWSCVQRCIWRQSFRYITYIWIGWLAGRTRCQSWGWWRLHVLVNWWWSTTNLQCAWPLAYAASCVHVLTGRPRMTTGRKRHFVAVTDRVQLPVGVCFTLRGTDRPIAVLTQCSCLWLVSLRCVCSAHWWLVYMQLCDRNCMMINSYPEV